ncbi:hypothetical protein [Marinobacter sp. MBR-105]|jgi:hypothetical protein
MTDLIVKLIPQVPTKNLNPNDRELAWEAISVFVSDDTPTESLEDEALDAFHDKVAVKCLEDFHYEVWKGGTCLTDAEPLAPHIEQQVDDAASLQKLIAAANELNTRGWSKHRICESIRSQLTDTSYADRLKAWDIKHLEIFIDVVSGVSMNEIREKHQAASAQRSASLYKGLTKIAKYCEIDQRLRKTFARGKIPESAKPEWVALAKEALQREKQPKETSSV